MISAELAIAALSLSAILFSVGYEIAKADDGMSLPRCNSVCGRDGGTLRLGGQQCSC